MNAEIKGTTLILLCTTNFKDAFPSISKMQNNFDILDSKISINLR